MSELTLSVPDISCGHCKMSIEGAVSTVEGVSAVDVDIEARTVAVSFTESTPLEVIVEAIEGQGYAVAG